MIKPAFNQKGVTLLELLVAISIAAIIVGVISSAIYSSMTGFNRLAKKQSVQEQARLVSEQVAATVRKKAYTEIKADNGILRFRNSDTDYVEFRYADNRITMVLQDGSVQQTMELASGVTNNPFSVEKPGNEYKITLNLVFDSASTQPYSYSSSLYTKNWSE